jgi:hypothetical protein
MNQSMPLTDEHAAVGAAVAALDTAWRTADPSERQRLLERALAPGAELVGPEPMGRHVGVAAIAALIGGFATRWPGAQVVVTTGVDVHHGWARYGWTIRSEHGELLLEGIDVAQVAPDGRLARIVMFYGAPPPLTRTRV